MNNRITLCLRVGALAVIAWMFISGRPPAGAQRSGQIMSTEHVVTRTDEDQDLAISKLQEFRSNQENWNRQTGATLELASSRTNQFWGGIVVIGALITGSVGLQFRRKPV